MKEDRKRYSTMRENKEYRRGSGRKGRCICKREKKIQAENGWEKQKDTNKEREKERKKEKDRERKKQREKEIEREREKVRKKERERERERDLTQLY